MLRRRKRETQEDKLRVDLAINRNDQSIRRLLDDLVEGTKQLKALYTTEHHDLPSGDSGQ